MRLKLTKALSLAALAPLVAAAAASCASQTDPVLVFANYESYMSEDLKARLRDEHRGLRFDYFTSNENMISNFKNGTYAIGAASTYAIIELIRQNELEPIDWSVFNLRKPMSGDPIVTANDALSLFIAPVQRILTGFAETPNLLEYCVPYFFQSFVFAYRGQQIPALADPGITWSALLDAVGSNPGRFADAKLAAVEDERSLFSVANLIASQNATVNPSPDSVRPSIPEYEGIFRNWSDGSRINTATLGKNPVPIFLNSDSTAILNRLATGAVNGAFLFNGDAIFAAQGGEDATTNPPTSDDFHFVTPADTPLALDCLVVSNKTLAKHPGRADEIYGILGTTALEGCDSNDPDAFEAMGADGLYANGPMSNFAYVQYVSPLKIVSGTAEDQADPNDANPDPALDVINSVVYTNQYFGDPDPNVDPMAEKITAAYTIPAKDNLTDYVEAPLNAWQKQAIVNAYVRFKASNWN